MNWLRQIVLRWLGVVNVNVSAVNALRLDKYDTLIVQMPPISNDRIEKFRNEITSWRKDRGLPEIGVMFMSLDAKISVLKNGGDPYSPRGILTTPGGTEHYVQPSDAWGAVEARVLADRVKQKYCTKCGARLEDQV